MIWLGKHQVQRHRMYTEGSLSEKTVTRFLLHITAAHNCPRVNASVHFLKSKSQQVHRGISPPPPDNFKMIPIYATMQN